MKSAWEMDKVQWLEPDEMCADRNPVCNTSPDEATSLRSEVPSVGPWESELLVTVAVCKRHLTWFSGRTTGPMRSSDRGDKGSVRSQ